MITFSDEQKEVLHNRFKKFQEWAKSEEGIKMIQTHKEKAEKFKQKFSKENISNITEDEFKQCWADSFAGGFISTIGQEKWWKKYIVKANGGFDNVKQKTTKLLYGSDEISQRFHEGMKEIKGFADSTLSEFLNNIYPDKYPIWNKKVRNALTNLGLDSILPPNLKDKIKSGNQYHDCINFMSDLKNELSKYGVSDFYDLDHFLWRYSDRIKKTMKPLVTEFSFVKKDFDSTTGKQADAQYLHQRFKELLSVLLPKLPPEFDKDNSYPFHPFNRGYQTWLNHAWLGMPRKGTFEKNVKDSLQFQVSLNKDDPLTFMIYLDDKARTKKKLVRDTINQKKEEFQERLKKLPINYVVGFKKAKDGKWSEFETSKVTSTNINSIIDALSERNSEFAVSKYVSAAEAIARKSLIVDDMVKSSEELLPLSRFLEGEDVTGSVEPYSTFISSSKYQKFNQILLSKKQIIFYGPPGTGKTYNALEFAKDFSGNTNSKYFRTVTFHPSYSYEEFVEGIKPRIDDQTNQVVFDIEDGIFKKICLDAMNERDKNFVLVIDELNRGNISKIFGELISLIENDKRLGARSEMKVNLAYSKKEFAVPQNVFIIGTMNTSDRSLVQIDLALRRRFGFVEFMPDYSKIQKEVDGFSLATLLENLNKLVLKHHRNREQQIGHTYFMNDKHPMDNISDIKFAFETEIIPLLQEYFYDDYNKLVEVLGPSFIDIQKQEIRNLTDDEFRQALNHILEYG